MNARWPNAGLLPVQLGRAVKPCRQNLTACGSDDKLVLKLRAALAICSGGCPAIWPGDIFVGASVDHGLDGEDVSFTHDSGSLNTSCPDQVHTSMSKGHMAVFFQEESQGSGSVQVVQTTHVTDAELQCS